MKIHRAVQDMVWLAPAVLLVLSLIGLAIPHLGLIVGVIVSVAALFISYLHLVQKPAYYLAWLLAFVVLFLIYNPIFSIAFFNTLGLPLNLIAAIIFIANWYLVFKAKGSIF